MRPTIRLGVGALCCAALAAACAGDAPAPETTAAPAVAEYAPTPFTAEEIRDANPPGTKLVFRMEGDGTPTALVTMLFVSGDDEHVVVESRTTTPYGQPLRDPNATSTTWNALRDHARWPETRVRRRQTTCEVPAGKFDCWLYTVREDDGATGRYYFATTRPGPPVLHEREFDGKVVYRMSLERVE